MIKLIIKLIVLAYGIVSRIGSKLMRIEERIPKMIKTVSLLILFIGASVLAAVYLRDKNLGILEPKGYIALQQRHLMIIGVLMSLIVVIPVFFMTFFIYSKYKDTNKKADYRPEWDHNKTIETVWWLVPLALILVLSVIAWNSSHDLDPSKPIFRNRKSMTIKVVALQWKWLFIYPEENIATVNYVELPLNTPVNFEITSDAPMNSFWIPQLGGQIYAMSGMSTHLNLMATSVGDYNGVSANISGDGFAGMKFVARVRGQTDYYNWLSDSRSKEPYLDMTTYDKLSLPSKDVQPLTYSTVDQSIYDKVVMKYMMSHASSTDGQHSSMQNGVYSNEGSH
jgi:cytochrome o ubiquinol oxidase subunit 2